MDCCLRCMPHHILSTGQAYRATLARQLQAAAAATSSAESPNGQCTRLPNVLLLDDFATVLDSLTAASVASTLGRTLLRLNMRALITTPQVSDSAAASHIPLLAVPFRTKMLNMPV
eukprot:COSAG02_NODE_1036_length_15051_cov_25.548154_12_plen_116_part_00